jgi:hypothetical protein
MDVFQTRGLRRLAMSYCLHILGLFVSIGLGCLASLMLALSIVRLFTDELESFGVFLICVPVFFLSYWAAGHLYTKYVCLGCPGCGNRLTIDYQPGVPISYACDGCGYRHQTHFTIGKGDWY